MNRTLTPPRRRIALLLGILMSMTVAAPAFADASGAAASEQVVASEPVVLVDGIRCIVLGSNGVEWTLRTVGACIDGVGPDVGPDGVEWT
jgi:hypothetical protein